MTEYIRVLGQSLIDSINDPERGFAVELMAFREEIDRLDPRDFLPSAQAKFVICRLSIRRNADHAAKYLDRSAFSVDIQRHIAAVVGEIHECLDGYGGPGSQAVRRDFSFVHDDELRTIIERDYYELSLILFPGGAWKSTIVLAGSILEAILQDRLTGGEKTTAAANAAECAPKKKGPVEKGRWDLYDLIRVAVELRIIPEGRANTVDEALRNYRNFIHPTRELRAGHRCTESEAQLAMGGLGVVCDALLGEGPEPA